jgi:hypothetical protein
VGVAVEGEGVDPGPSGVTEAEELGDLVEGFAGSVVEGAADEGVAPGVVCGASEKKVSVAAGDDQSQGGLVVEDLLRFLTTDPFRKRTKSRSFGFAQDDRGTQLFGRVYIRCGLSLIEQNGVDVAFEVVDCDEWKILGEGQRFGVCNTNQERAGQSGTVGDGDGV